MRKPYHFLLSVLLFGYAAFSASAVTLDEARRLIDKKDYVQAAEAFRTLMKTRSISQRADCNKWYGEALCMTGHYDEAIPYLETAGKRQVKGAFWYLGICRQKRYEFDRAIEAFTKYKGLIKNSELWTARCDSAIAECEIAQRALSHVENVEIIDSMVVAKKTFFNHYKLGYESGRIIMDPAMQASVDSLAEVPTIFESQNKDHRIGVAADSDGQLRLYETHYFDQRWGTPEPITSITMSGKRMGYPFLRTDGETLYFASDQTPGVGGMDIYVAHYDSEEKVFYTPERLGMPFNSPYDDYMMAIDETHHVGWWATDRRQIQDSLVIYLFKINEEPIYLEGSQVSRGRIDRIADSWNAESGYADLLGEIYNARQVKKQETKSLHIVIDDKHVYSSVDQFKSAEAQQLYFQSLQLEEQLVQLESELDQLRQEWSSADTSRRNQLRPLILQREQRCQRDREQLKTTQKLYRNAEIKSL